MPETKMQYIKPPFVNGKRAPPFRFRKQSEFSFATTLYQNVGGIVNVNFALPVENAQSRLLLPPPKYRQHVFSNACLHITQPTNLHYPLPHGRKCPNDENFKMRCSSQPQQTMRNVTKMIYRSQQKSQKNTGKYQFKIHRTPTLTPPPTSCHNQGALRKGAPVRDG